MHHMQALLKHQATAEGRMLGHSVPKHHMAEHMAEQFRFLNPRLRCRPRTNIGPRGLLRHPARTLSSTIMERYRLMLHITYTRRIQEE